MNVDDSMTTLIFTFTGQDVAQVEAMWNPTADFRCLSNLYDIVLPFTFLIRMHACLLEYLHNANTAFSQYVRRRPLASLPRDA